MAYTGREQVENNNIENNNIIRRQIIAGLQRTRYRKIPQTMMRHLTIISTEKLNDFPVNGTLNTHSPNQIMGHKTHEGTGDYLCEFGRRVGIKDNISTPTYDAISLRRNYDRQDEYIVMEIVTGEEVVIGHVNPIPMTNRIKDRVEQLAHDENIENQIFTIVDTTTPSGAIQYQNVGVRSDEVDDDDESILLPIPTRVQRNTVYNINLDSEDSTDNEESKEEDPYYSNDATNSGVEEEEHGSGTS